MQAKSITRIVSVNVGLPRQVVWKDRTVSTGIFKEPVEGSIRVRGVNLEGDQQADLTVHGGPDKAIYVYPAEYYDFWRKEYPDLKLNWGMFGENLTVEGLLDNAINIGDIFTFGSVKAAVTQPRMPCYKLGLKFGRDDILKRFLNSGYSGFYLKVIEEGEVSAGDAITLLQRDPNEVKVLDITRLYVNSHNEPEILKRAIQVEALPQSWRTYFEERIEQLAG